MKFYNKTSGPLMVSMSSGASIFAPPKAWFSVPDNEGISANLVDFISKGYIIAQQVEAPPVVKPAAVSIPLIIKSSRESTAAATPSNSQIQAPVVADKTSKAAKTK